MEVSRIMLLTAALVLVVAAVGIFSYQSISSLGSDVEVLKATRGIPPGAITSERVATGAVNTVKIADSAVTSAKISADTILAADIAAGAVNTSELAAGAVTSAKISDGTIETEDIKDSAVTKEKIADASVTTAEIADGSVISADIEDNTIVPADAMFAPGAATFVVALDGTGDYDDIQTAIDALPPAGGSVYVKQGTYPIGSSISITKDNVSLIGAGRATSLFLEDGADCPVINVGDGTNYYQGILIANLSIDGNRTNQTAALNVGPGAGLDGIRFYYIENSTVKNCWVFNDNRWGIDLCFSCRNTVIANTCTNNAQSGIFVGSCSHCTVIGNIVDNNKYGVWLYDSTHNTIGNNVVKDCTNAGIYLLEADTNSISSNTCSGCDEGIALYQSDNNTITGNTCDGNGNGIRLWKADKNNLSANSCTNGRYGICVWPESNLNKLTANYCHGNATENISDEGTGTVLIENADISRTFIQSGKAIVTKESLSDGVEEKKVDFAVAFPTAPIVTLTKQISNYDVGEVDVLVSEWPAPTKNNFHIFVENTGPLSTDVRVNWIAMVPKQ